MKFLRSALFHALRGERATYNAKLRALMAMYEPRDNDNADNNDNNDNEVSSVTPVVDEKEVLERTSHSLRRYLQQAKKEFAQALQEAVTSAGGEGAGAGASQAQ